MFFSDMARRGLAVLIDAVLCGELSLLVTGLAGLMLSLDSLPGLLAGLFPGLALGFIYFVWSPWMFSNSVGRFVARVRVLRAAEGGPPSALQWLMRGVLAGLWPIEALLILFTGRRLGDRLAGTVVVLDGETRRHCLQRGLLGAALLAAGYLSAMGVMALAAANSGAFRAAAAHITEQRVGEAQFGDSPVIGRLPRLVEVAGGKAQVVLPAGGAGGAGFVAVVLEQKGGAWRPVSSGLVEQPPRRYRFSQGSSGKLSALRWSGSPPGAEPREARAAGRARRPAVLVGLQPRLDALAQDLLLSKVLTVAEVEVMQELEELGAQELLYLDRHGIVRWAKDKSERSVSFAQYTARHDILKTDAVTQAFEGKRPAVRLVADRPLLDVALPLLARKNSAVEVLGIVYFRVRAGSTEAGPQTLTRDLSEEIQPFIQGNTRR